MDKNRIIALKSSFDGISNSVAEVHIEFWYARDLMGLLGYTRWENFSEAIKRAETSCSSNNIDISYHFRDVTKMINLPKGAKREIADVMLSRYAWQADLQGEAAITDDHVTNNTTVREMLGKRGIVPENLPPAPDIRKLERSVRRQDKVIAANESAHLPPPSDGK